MVTAAAADDDSSSIGVDNPAYDPAAVTSAVSRELAQHAEVVRDTSVYRDDSAYKRWRPGRKPHERPQLSRYVSDMSDASNSTTSTFVTSTPSLRSNVELQEQL